MNKADMYKSAGVEFPGTDGMPPIESTPHDEPNPPHGMYERAAHYSEQMAGLLEVFQKAVMHLDKITEGGYTWVTALGDVLDEYDWTIISKDHEAELSKCALDLQALVKTMSRWELGTGNDDE